jgi:hypothetical protein
MYAHYAQYDEGILKQMDESLKEFHDSKGIFRQFRA